jgi:hypothetical protein
MRELSPRGRLLRDAAIYTPLFLGCLGLLLWMTLDPGARAVVGMILLAGMAFLFGYQSLQSLRDLREQPLTITGPITRRWTKRDAFVSKSYYITVERAIYRIPVQVYLDLLVKDGVAIVAYPHTGTVLSVERVSRPEPEEPAASQPSKSRMRTLRTARLSAPARGTGQAASGGTVGPAGDEQAPPAGSAGHPS